MERPPCQEACPYITSQIPKVEMPALAVDLSAPYGSINILYLWRQFRARNCDGPLPLPGDNQVTYCSTLQRGILPNGRRASALVDKQLSSYQQMEARNPERWRVIYQEQQAERDTWYRSCVEALRSDAFTADEVAIVRGASMDDIVDLFGVDILDDEEIEKLLHDPEARQKCEMLDRYTTLHEIVESADEIASLMRQLGPQTTEAQAIGAAVAMHDAEIRQSTSLLLLQELQGNSQSED